MVQIEKRLNLLEYLGAQIRAFLALKVELQLIVLRILVLVVFFLLFEIEIIKFAL